MLHVRFTRHALDKLFRLGIRQERAEKAIHEGILFWEGKKKFKALLKGKKALLIIVCEEYPSEVTVITVLQKRG